MASSFDPQEFDDVEIVISRATDGSGYMAHIRLLDFEPSFNKLPPPPFANLDGASDPLTYGEQLFQWLFRDEVGKVFLYARQLASEPTRGFKSGTRLRLRLSLDPQSSEIRHLCWESLYTPEGHLPFSLTTAFSRFIRTRGLRGGPFRERPLRMLLAISNPEGIDGSTLDVVDPDLEKSIIKDATRSSGPLLKLDRLQGPPTLAGIQAAVEKGYHIVHLLALAVVHDEQGYLVLSDDAGQAQEVSIEAIVRTIVSPSQSPPGLVFLGVPLAAGNQGGETLLNLAQMLIEAGVQSLVAIRSPIGESNLRRFIERFYSALMRTGVVDVAVREARNEIYRPDNWEWTYPVLYMRMPDGRLFEPLPVSLENDISGFNMGNVE